MDKPPKLPDEGRWIRREALQQAVIDHYGGDAINSLHGVSHWQRVEAYGLLLAADTGADTLVVSLFAWFHDSCRVTEHTDHGHGRRGAEFARQQKGTLFDLDDSAFSLFLEACNDHTDGKTSQEVTIGTCWDADRLDLKRVRKQPDSLFMSTEKGRQLAKERNQGQ